MPFSSHKKAFFGSAPTIARLLPVYPPLLTQNIHFFTLKPLVLIRQIILLIFAVYSFSLSLFYRRIINLNYFRLIYFSARRADCRGQSESSSERAGPVLTGTALNTSST